MDVQLAKIGFRAMADSEDPPKRKKPKLTKEQRKTQSERMKETMARLRESRKNAE